MKQKLLLTSVCALTFAIPAFAEPANTSENFPNAANEEYMQVDYRYLNAAKSENMDGVYEDNDIVYAKAMWEALPACNINDYTSEQLVEMGFAHAKTLTGTEGACEIDACENGWHVANTLSDIIGESAYIYYANLENGYLHEVAAATPEVPQAHTINLHDQSYYGINENNLFAVQYPQGIVTGHAICSTRPGTSWDQEGAVDNNIVEGELTDETNQEGAQYCYCQLSRWNAPAGSSNLNDLSSRAWIYVSDMTTDKWCHLCSRQCASLLTENLAFRDAVFNATELPAVCAANTINVKWYAVGDTELDAESVAANNAGTVMYGSDINTPKYAPSPDARPGYKFIGWEFSKDAPQPSGE